jgi:signal transduction histidine kinase
VHATGLPFHRIRLVIGCLLLTLAGCALGLASPMPAKAVDPGQDHFWLGGALSFLKDPSGVMSFEAVRAAAERGAFEPVQDFSVTTGYLADKPIWVHFTLDYPAGDTAVWWLLMAPELLDTVTVFAEQPDGRFTRHEGGRSLPFDRREMVGIGHAFRLGQDPGGLRHYFIRATTKVAIKVEPSLWQERRLSQYLMSVNTTLGIYVGIVALLIVGALLRAVRYRHPWDIAYFSYITSFEVFNLSNAGLVQAWGLTDSPDLRQALLQGGIFLTGLSFVYLTRTLIFWPDSGSRWLRLWPAWVLGLLISLGVTAILNPVLVWELNFNGAVILLALSTLAGLWASWRNYPNARLMTLCFLPFVLWAVYVAIARWLEAPLPDAWSRSRVLMVTSLLHMFLLWFLILSQDARLEQAQRQLKFKLESMQNEMSNMSLFFSMLAHELNHPLQSLLGLAQLDKDTLDRSDAHALRHRLLEVGREFSDILDTCTQRVQLAATNNLMPESVNLPALLKAIADHFQQKTSEHLIRCDLATLPSSFDCDPKLVGILLSNLLENAIRYAEPDGVIWVRGRQMGGNAAEITVENEGPAIPKAMQQQIFERYVQLADSKCEQRGMGMGLFIVQRIAEMHQGTVVCESEPGQGTTFRVTLKATSLRSPDNPDHG